MVFISSLKSILFAREKLTSDPLGFPFIIVTILRKEINSVYSLRFAHRLCGSFLKLIKT
jgi:hypothetical protein